MTRRRRRWTSVLMAAGLAGSVTAATPGPAPEIDGYRLLERRIEVREKTEVEVDLPPNCVLTGLGARAHADNLTTLHVQYREVLADGTLGPPRELRAGAEPDHACEAKVVLPEGWIAVGFGARGAPEWDVATLRVWGRPWPAADATQSVPRAWSDGREPEAGLERSIEPIARDRVLVGVGLRFHQNDIQGIYARSARVVPVPADRRSLRRARTADGVVALILRPLDVGPIALGALDPDRLQARLLDLYHRGVKRVFVNVDGVEATAAEPVASVCELLLEDPFRPADGALRAVVARRVGPEHVDTVVRALSRVPALSRLTFSAAGKTFLGRSGGVPRLDEVPDFDEDSDRVVDREKETARWLLVQSRAEIDGARQAGDCPWLRLVADDLALYDRAIAFWEDLARAEVWSRRFLVDGAPSTHAAALEAVERIREANVPEAFGDATPLVRRILERLRTSESLTLLGGRLAEIQEATASDAAGAGGRAAEMLAALLEDPASARAIDRHWTRIGNLASATSAFGHDTAALRVRFGGDGRWTAARRGDRWAWVTTPNGPCVYFDVEGTPDRVVLRFEVFDDEEGRVDVHYNSVDPSTGERSDYRAAAPVPLTGVGGWRVVEVPLDRCVFLGRQNLGADFRLIPNRRGVAIRAVQVERAAALPISQEGRS